MAIRPSFDVDAYNLNRDIEGYLLRKTNPIYATMDLGPNLGLDLSPQAISALRERGEYIEPPAPLPTVTPVTPVTPVTDTPATAAPPTLDELKQRVDSLTAQVGSIGPGTALNTEMQGLVTQLGQAQLDHQSALAASTPTPAPVTTPQSTWANPFSAGGIGQIFPGDEGVTDFESLFNTDTSRGLQAISPFLGKYRNAFLRNPGAVKGAYEAFELQNPVGEGEGGAANFFAQFNPDQFVGRLNPFERGVNPSQFASRQRRIFR